MHFLRPFVALCATSSVLGFNIGRRAATTSSVTATTSPSAAKVDSSTASSTVSSTASSSSVGSSSSSSLASSATASTTSSSSQLASSSAEPSATETDGAPPIPTAWQLHPNGNLAKCLDITNDTRVEGTNVQIYDCNGTPAQDWVFDFGNTTVQLSDTDFCLDAGNQTVNGSNLTILACNETSPSQQFYYTEDLRLALRDQAGFCLDLTDGILDNGNRVQSWKCFDDNTNQIWTT
ncbi:hypothetical protein HGRIS_004502 [Hohenbuehelia grisea]|uniref:Ricin B lectin domain-containing protein n=1 Tax=Hohenbuehelia grisea TaxID=104357 RepID=A0ABR3JCN6_9AGAR